MSTTIALGLGGIATLTQLDLPVPGSMAAVVHGEFFESVQHVSSGAKKRHVLQKQAMFWHLSSCMGACGGVGDLPSNFDDVCQAVR